MRHLNLVLGSIGIGVVAIGVAASPDQKGWLGARMVAEATGSWLCVATDLEAAKALVWATVGPP